LAWRSREHKALTKAGEPAQFFENVSALAIVVENGPQGALPGHAGGDENGDIDRDAISATLRGR
jgi:hypothetical protein